MLLKNAAPITPDKITIRVTSVSGACNKVAMFRAIGVVTARVANYLNIFMMREHQV
jgi:hypothetical protein